MPLVLPLPEAQAVSKCIHLHNLASTTEETHSKLYIKSSFGKIKKSLMPEGIHNFSQAVYSPFLPKSVSCIIATNSL